MWFCHSVTWKWEVGMCVRMGISVCYKLCAILLEENGQKDLCTMKNRITWIDVVQIDISCTLKKTGLFIAKVTKAHEYMPERTHAHIDENITHTITTRYTHKCILAFKPKWSIYVHYPLSILYNFSLSGIGLQMRLTPDLQSYNSLCQCEAPCSISVFLFLVKRAN